MRFFLRLSLIAAAGLAVVVGWNTARFESRQIAVEPAPPLEVEASQAAGKLAAALRIPTVSYPPPTAFDPAPFEELGRFLAASFPGVFRELQYEKVGDASLLLRWEGADRGLLPALLLAHQDVVPVEPGTEANWTEPPFAGRIADGYVWGRGALDDKASLVAILEAVERLIVEGERPRRTLYLAFGHDEELGGPHGAASIANLLRARGVEAEFALDEGMAVLEGIIPGVEKPVALIGVAEKGVLTLDLRVSTAGGHSSMPPPQTAIGILSAAIVKLEQNPLPAVLEGPAREMLRYLGPEMPLAPRVALANPWLFGRLLLRRLAATPSTNALLRTTTAPTIIAGGVKENVLPSQAHAAVNFRIRPGETSQRVIEHARQVIDDPRVEIQTLQPLVEPSPVSPLDSDSFRMLQRTVGEVFPGAITAPGLVVGATDSRYYTAVTPNIYRFLPLHVGPQDIARIHSKDERIAVDNYVQAIRFYHRLLRNVLF